MTWEPTLTNEEIDQYITEQLKKAPRYSSPFVEYVYPRPHPIVQTIVEDQQ